jgi:hypothetical protein
MKYALAAAVLAAGTAAQAGGIKFSGITQGEALRYEASNGQVLEHVFQGRSWGRYVVATYALDGDSRSKMFEARFDREGRLVEIRDAANQKIRYDPHRCTDVVGTCRYEVVLPGGVREPRVQTLSEEGGLQKITVQNGAGKVISTSERVLDNNGWTQRSTVQAGGQTLTITRVNGR